MNEEPKRLTDWAVDIADDAQTCVHCGDLILMITPLAALGENGSYFCGETTKQPHEVLKQ